MRNGNSLTERLDGMHINWSIDRREPASRARVDFTREGKYTGSVTGLGNAVKVGELVLNENKDLLEAIFECGGFVGLLD